MLPLGRKSFSLPGFYFGFSALLSRKIVQLLPPDHFHPWLRGALFRDPVKMYLRGPYSLAYSHLVEPTEGAVPDF